MSNRLTKEKALEKLRLTFKKEVDPRIDDFDGALRSGNWDDMVERNDEIFNIRAHYDWLKTMIEALYSTTE